MLEKVKSLSQDENNNQENNASSSDIDMQELAHQLYEQLCRELEIENERLGQS